MLRVLFAERIALDALEATTLRARGRILRRRMICAEG
jgi:hypothetical protein